MDWIIGIGMMALGSAVVVLLWRNYCLRKEAAQFAGKVEQCTGRTEFMYPRNLDF